MPHTPEKGSNEVDSIRVYADPTLGNPSRWIADCGYGEEHMANARLIAAAPELLKASEDFMRETSNGTSLCGAKFFDALREAIAKAKGVSS